MTSEVHFVSSFFFFLIWGADLWFVQFWSNWMPDRNLLKTNTTWFQFLSTFKERILFHLDLRLLHWYSWLIGFLKFEHGDKLLGCFSSNTCKIYNIQIPQDQQHLIWAEIPSNVQSGKKISKKLLWWNNSVIFHQDSMKTEILIWHKYTTKRVFSMEMNSD